MPEKRRLPALRSLALRSPALLAPVLLAAVLAAGGGCSLSYEEARVGEELAAEIPETVMTGFTHTVVDEGRLWVKMAAERAESYGKTKRIVLAGVRFEEYDAQGGLATEASADWAVYHTDSENAEVQGGILIRSSQEKASLSAVSLSWVKEGRRLEGGPGQEVRIAKDDGSFLEGRGFRADFRRRRLQFAEGVSGGYVEGGGEGR
jgi:LPS export ABC transporter protein LptC